MVISGGFVLDVLPKLAYGLVVAYPELAETERLYHGLTLFNSKKVLQIKQT